MAVKDKRSLIHLQSAAQTDSGPKNTSRGKAYLHILYPLHFALSACNKSHVGG